MRDVVSVFLTTRYDVSRGTHCCTEIAEGGWWWARKTRSASARRSRFPGQSWKLRRAFSGGASSVVSVERFTWIRSLEVRYNVQDPASWGGTCAKDLQAWRRTPGNINETVLRNRLRAYFTSSKSLTYTFSSLRIYTLRYPSIR